MIIFLFLTLLGYFLFFTLAFNIPLAIVPFFTVCFITSSLYLFGFIGCLNTGALLFFYIGIILLFVSLFFNFKYKKIQLTELCQPSIVIFFILFILLWLKLSQMIFVDNDEFGHWAFVIKEMFVRNSLPVEESALIFQDYPPGTALFEYFVLKIFGRFKEGLTYFANSIFLLSCLSIFLYKTKWKDFLRIICILLGWLFLIYFFEFKIETLTVDGILSFIFGTSLAVYFIADDKVKLVSILPALFLLPLIKQVGILFVFCVLSIILLNEFFIKKFNRTTKIRKLFLFFAIIAIPLSSYISFKYYVHSHNLIRSFNHKVSSANIKKSFSVSNSTHRDKITITRFTKELFGIYGKKFNIKNAVYFYILLFAFLMYFSRKYQKDILIKKQIAVTHFLLLFWFAVYLFGILCLYLYTFGEYEGINLASFGRYQKIFLLAWTLVSLGFFIKIKLNNPKLTNILKISSLIFLLLSLAKFQGLKKLVFEKQTDNQLIETVRIKIDSIAKYVPEDKSVYIIWQNSIGEKLRICRYMLIPRITNWWYWSLGKPYHENDIWTNDWDVKQFEKRLSTYDTIFLNFRHRKTYNSKYLKGFDYLFLGYADDQFWNKYWPLFENGKKDKSGILFEIKKKKQSVVFTKIM
jgi:hypothetical protein